MKLPSIVVVGAARTPIGKYAGAFATVPAHELGAAAVKAALSRAQVSPEAVDEVIMGCIAQVGPDAYNARRVSIAAGIPVSSTAVTVNRLCGSGLESILTGAMQLQVGASDVVVAGGDENMTRVPFLMPEGRAGFRLGDRTLIDGTLSILTDPWSNQLMGSTAEAVARAHSVSRLDQDTWAALSQQRAVAAMARGVFTEQIVAIDVLLGKGKTTTVDTDEHPRAGTTVETLASLVPSFAKDGTVTAGNSSGINDGAAAVVLMREDDAKRDGRLPMLRLRAWARGALEPGLMGFAPAIAIPRALAKAGMSITDLDVVELNEAFAAQVVAVMRATNMTEEQTNPNGGAIAFGHPVGATGAILTTRLAYYLRDQNLQAGMVTMCIGGGQALAAIFERC
jgi:acetyl-CoA C-acetyltransferase